MQSWMLRHISDYWDQRVDAIDRLSRAFAALPKGEKETAFNAIYDSVTLHADKLSTEEMCKFAVAMVDDLYKAANQMSQFDQDHLQYLRGIEWVIFGVTAREPAHYVDILHYGWAWICHQLRMARAAKRSRRLSDTYWFPGFRPEPTVRGIFGDPKALVIGLKRRSKKRCAAVAVASRWAGTTARCAMCAIFRAATNGYFWNWRCGGLIVAVVAR